MSSVVIAGNTSGTITLDAPNVAGTTVLTLPTANGTVLTTANTFAAGTGPAFSAYQGSNQSVTATIFTKIQINTEEFDTNSNYDNSTNYRFTPTVAGYYQVNGCLTLITSTQGYVTIYKNGVTFKGGNNIPPNGVSMVVSALIYMNGTTDYIELYGYSGINNTFQSGQENTYFQAFLARAA